MGQTCDLPCLMQGIGCFNQHMHGNFAGNFVAAAQLVEHVNLYLHLVGGFRLGQHDVGNALPGTTDDDFQFVAPTWMPDVMDANTDAVKAVFGGL